MVDLPSRLADGLAGAAGRGPGALDRTAPQPRLDGRLRRLHSQRRPGAERKALRPRPDRADRQPGAGRGLAHSAALVRIWLRERFSLAPELQPLAIGATPADCAADAVMLIGDGECGHPAATSPSTGTWARSGIAGPGCRLYSPCGSLAPAWNSLQRARPWPRPRRGNYPARGDRPASGPDSRNPGSRVPCVPSRSP